MSHWRLDWPSASGPRLGTAVMRSQPEDFQVVEEMASPFSGEGEHLCLFLEKRGDNTEYVARQLASMTGIRPFDVGFCGLKDRHAVTRQWFSLYRPGRTDDTGLVEAIGEHWVVLEQSRHQRKLRRGDHVGNRFRLTLRDVTAPGAALDERLAAIRAGGIPNYFGPQRFGRDGNNLSQAVAQGDRPRRGRNFKAGMAFSAARSWLFNEVLAERVARGDWGRLLDGDPWSSEPSGPLWGDGGTQATGELEAIERAVVARHPDMAAVFASTRMKPERRPLMLPISGLDWNWPGPDCLQLDFRLAPGGFATALVAEILDTVAGGSDANPAS
ncbi:tRNA pseudouridine(13) synthase TruD [Marinobacter halodurans]|uniref:tRNA pseudouridine synthase D n=1 Tax=Marinobacter halodurans TaxID=2528979 RepID=A0ABY1ZKH2_9GAMM|nr:tRNA pseudouridine(13) synthase TruD [Marinobacter halodurans]TBW54459.1 tRNA pseudouridine(13) synthase TruD [Marinobacter halodurans]